MSDDRLRGSLLSIIDAATRALRWHRLVRARVVHVLAGGLVETMPETQGTSALSAVPLRYGLPGVLRAVAKTGARCLVAFAEGDPAQPFVAAWDPGQLESLEFDVSGGAQHLARSGDAVDCGMLVFSPTGSYVGYIPPGGVDVPIPPGGTGVALQGVVTGTSRVKA